MSPRLECSAGLDGEPELGVQLPRWDVSERVRLRPRRDAQHDRRPLALGNDVAQKLELVSAVDDDRGAGAIRSLEVFAALVVAEKVDAVSFRSGLQREVELAR